MPSYRLVLAFALLGVVLPTISSAAGAPTSTELLSHYQSLVNSFASRKVSTDDLRKVIKTDVAGKSDVTWERLSTIMQLDASRLRIRQRAWYIKDPNEQCPPERAMEFNFLWDGKEWYEYYVPQGRTNTWLVFSHDVGDRQKCIYDSFESALFGFITGDSQDLVSILQQASKLSIREGREDVDGHSCIVVDAVAPSGAYTLWFDDSRAYNLLRVNVRKRGDDLYLGKSLASLKISEFDCTISNVVLAFKSDTWLPMAADIVSSEKLQSGVQYLQNVHHSYTEIVLNPDFNSLGTFLPDFPDFTPASDKQGRPGFEWIWYKGNVVPAALDLQHYPFPIRKADGNAASRIPD